MARIEVTEDKLVEMIQKQIETSDEQDGDCRGVRINAVTWHEPDSTGCNWDVKVVGGEGAAECKDVIRFILRELMENYNIPEKNIHCQKTAPLRFTVSDFKGTGNV